ncbi:MAG: prolyl oligopeptidase family serine peptidase [Acidobacteriota bacterium]
MRLRFSFLTAITLLIGVSAIAQTATQYQQPPADIVKMLEAAPFPQAQVSPDGKWLLLSERPAMPSITDLAQPMLRLAGTRISPKTNSTFLSQGITRLTLTDLTTKKSRDLTLPPNPKIAYVSWSPDGRRLAFSQPVANGLELWLADVITGKSSKVASVWLNATTGMPYQWLPDSSGLICKVVPKARGAEPKAPEIPNGPKIQESLSGEKAAVATFQDLLKNAYDEALFKYYFTAELARVDQSGNVTALGQSGIFDDFDISPDGKYVYAAKIVEPFSYFVPFSSFTKELEVYDAQGKLVHHLASLPVAENTPINGVRKGPRNVQWQANLPATLVYVEALDEGNPKNKVPFRDQVKQLDAPFKGTAKELIKSEFRFGSLQWTEKGDLAIWSESDRPTRKARTYLQDLTTAGAKPRLIFDLQTEDRYNNPGFFVTGMSKTGQRVLKRSSDGQNFYLSGQGASPQGERPFLRRFNLQSLKAEEIFRSQNPYYESLVSLLDDDGKQFITSRESTSEPPNYYLHDGQAVSAITGFADPQPQFRNVKKQLITYKRSDGIQLSGTLYLPPDYKEGERRPAFIWAYPNEFASADAASQISGSPNRFTRVSGASHLFFALKGYVVLDNASMPILGGDKANDTFVEQLVMNAQAAIDKIVEMGVADRDRIGVGGHSYGAFMTANLLAHSDLFRAGIARSGAYNRSLTPFTFQNERRTFWEAQQVYTRMSPFFYADKINEPILMTHGEADNNSGTFPIQSERLYAALKGLGKTARFVLLPLESHGYAARESNLHVLSEMLNWMDKYVKNAPPRQSDSAMKPANK